MRGQTTDDRDSPRWVAMNGAAALVVKCAKCYDHPGSKHDDGSGVCEACRGGGWRVLALATGTVTPREGAT